MVALLQDLRFFLSSLHYPSPCIVPTSPAPQGYESGTDAPGRCSDRTTCAAGNSTTEPYLCVHSVALAHASAVALFRSKHQERVPRPVCAGCAACVRVVYVCCRWRWWDCPPFRSPSVSCVLRGCEWCVCGWRCFCDVFLGVGGGVGGWGVGGGGWGFAPMWSDERAWAVWACTWRVWLMACRHCCHRARAAMSVGMRSKQRQRAR